MRDRPERWAEKHRLTNAGSWSSTREDRNNGVFEIPYRGVTLRVQVSDGMDWEHVSVSLPDRCPTWAEMDYIKSLFWKPSECVVQYHPPLDGKINLCKTCLHLWRPTKAELPMPPNILV